MFIWLAHVYSDKSKWNSYSFSESEWKSVEELQCNLFKASVLDLGFDVVVNLTVELKMTKKKKQFLEVRKSVEWWIFWLKLTFRTLRRKLNTTRYAFAASLTTHLFQMQMQIQRHSLKSSFIHVSIRKTYFVSDQSVGWSLQALMLSI